MKLATNIYLISLAFLALHHEVAAMSIGKASQHLQQPGHLESPKAKTKEKDVPPVVKVEHDIRDGHRDIMSEIDRFRAKICAQLKDEHGMAFNTFMECHKFMTRVCVPGKDKSMDGDTPEVSSGKGYCKEYFPELKEPKEPKEKEPEEEEKEEKKAVKAVGPAPGPYPGPAPAPKAAKNEKAPAPAPATATAAAAPGTASGPAPGPMGVPGPAPVPGPFIPGKSGGKPWGAIADDEAYYYEKDGKDIGRMHMDEKLGLPTQGYWGKLVEHEDQKTMTDDWMREFGPKSGHKNIAEACRKYPDSPWCRRKGFGRNLRNSGSAAIVHFLPLLTALLVGM